MPGPLAAQVAMWAGYLRRGALGAAATAVAFIIPSFLMVTAVAALYVHYAGLRAVQSLCYGIAPAVMAIIAIAAWKLVRLTDGRNWRAWAIRGVVFAVTAITGQEPIYLIIGAGLLMITLDARPALRPPRRKPPRPDGGPPVHGSAWLPLAAAAARAPAPRVGPVPRRQFFLPARAPLLRVAAAMLPPPHLACRTPHP